MPDTFHLPRLLCLHGGGVNATIFRRQTRILIRALESSYRLVFADAPYTCDPGPGVTAAYADYGPFRRWLRWLPEHPPVDDRDAVRDIEASMSRAMQADDAQGGRGPWHGLVGFSQGGKVAASVLFEMQTRRNRAPQKPLDDLPGFAGGSWRFALLLAARGPLVALGDATFDNDMLELPGLLGTPPKPGDMALNTHRLRLPTVHVHGLKDPGLVFHRALLQDFTSSGSAESVEWDGAHRLPIKTADVDRVVTAMLKAAKKAEMLDFMSSRTMAFDGPSLLRHT